MWKRYFQNILYFKLYILEEYSLGSYTFKSFI